MRVYADLFFMLNAAADFTLLAVAGRLAGMPLRLGRLLAGAAFGGLYGVAALLMPWPPAFSPVGAAAAAALMILLTYAPTPARVVLRLLAFFYGAAALLAGLTLLLSMGGSGGTVGDIPWWAFALALGGCLVGGAWAWDRWRPEARARWLCDLEVTVCGRRAVCRALVDTGNALRDPWGDGPAVLVDAAVLRGLLPAALLACLAGNAAGIPDALAEVAAAAEPGEAWPARVRLIPFRTVGTRGMLCGLRPDLLRVRARGRWLAMRAIVGVSPQPLDPEAGYRALVPSCLVAAAAPAAEDELPGGPEVFRQIGQESQEGRGAHGAATIGL